MKKSKKKHGYFDNLKYIVKTHWAFDKLYIIATVAATPMAALTSVISAFLPKVVLDCVENKTSFGELALKVGLMSLAVVVFEYLNRALVEKAAEKEKNSREVLFHRLLCDKVMTMDYNSYVYNETRALREKAWHAVSNWDGGVFRFLELNSIIVSSFFGFSAFTAIIAQCNPIFIPILIVCYAVSALGWMLLQKYKDKIKDEYSAIMLKLNYVCFRSRDFSNAKDIRIYNMTDFLMKKINLHLAQINVLNTKRNNGHYYNVLLEDFFKFGISLGAYAYLVYLKVNSEMTLGDFTLYFGAITGFGTWLNTLVDSISDLVSNSHSVSDYREFLDIPDKMNTGAGVPLPTKAELPCEIELKNLSFSYDKSETKTLDNINLKIRKGEKIAIVGTNGAGKSTLVKLICGLFIPSDGKILLNGVDSSLFNRDEYYTLFSTLFQDCVLLPANVAKNIALCEERKIDRARLQKCIKTAGIYDKIMSLPQQENTLLVREVNEGGMSLSGGELQRLLLARALYKDAPVIILDEPTAALDPIAENEMYLRYNELTENKTAIYISHRLSSTRFCDRILLLDNGKIVEEGTHDELLALDGKYAEMFKTQSKYYKKEAVM